MQLYAAIDLHSNNSVLAVIDEEDVLKLRRKLPNDIEPIRHALEPFRESLAGVVVESTFNWYWLVDGLMESGYTLHLANTAAVPQYSGLKHGDDNSDARHLANLLRLKILRKGYISARATPTARPAEATASPGAKINRIDAVRSRNVLAPDGQRHPSERLSRPGLCPAGTGDAASTGSSRSAGIDSCLGGRASADRGD